MMFNPDYQQSLDHSDYTVINHNQLKFAKDFFPSSSPPKGIKATTDSIPGTFTSLDPRLIDVMRGYRMDLNVPAFDSTFHDKQRRTNIIHPQSYQSYKDITGGQVFYYSDKYLRQPYFSPNFQLRSQVSPTIFEDPMGSLKPQYERIPITNSAYISGYTSDQDQISFREDIMARQMRTMNQQSYSLLENSETQDFPLTKNPFC